MTDLTTLRQTLHSTDNTAPAIQSSSRALMTFYDKPNGGPNLAVSEWRNALQTCRSVDRLLPLLYVANEVLQTSKRNRGNKFLEAFSPVLGSSLVFVCERLVGEEEEKGEREKRELVEKVRRTVKIWGDRRIFSMRFVMDILAGLEKYRSGRPVGIGGGGGAKSGAKSGPPATLARREDVDRDPSSHDDDDGDNGGNDDLSDEDDDDDDDDLFGGSGAKLLDVDVRVDTAALNAEAQQQLQQQQNHQQQQQQQPNASSSVATTVFGAGAKRRRSTNLPVGNKSSKSDSDPSNLNNNNNDNDNNNNTSPASSTLANITPTSLSTQSLLSFFQTLQNLDDKYNSSLSILSSIPTAYLDSTNSDIDDLVGDELTDMYKKVSEMQLLVKKERRTMYHVALQKRELEKGANGQARRFVGWLKDLIDVDKEELEFCQRLDEKLDVLAVFQAEAKILRERKRDEDARKAAEAEALARRLAEENERKRLLDDVKKEAEAKPGMVWNPQLREYQYLHDPTQETWRD